MTPVIGKTLQLSLAATASHVSDSATAGAESTLHPAMVLTSLEICAGAGGQALGVACAGFHHVALVENDSHACETLRLNRPEWNIVEGDLRMFDARYLRGALDLLAGGVPCPPFSKAGRQLGADDERDLFPEALRLVRECEPRAVLLENVRGLLDPVFDGYRSELQSALAQLGYESEWRLLHASDFGVPQLRPRAILVAIRDGLQDFAWPEPQAFPSTVGEVLFPAMRSRGWEGAARWRRAAERIGPTLVGGSKRHGGPDLGPTRARRAWAELGVDGRGLADHPPPPGFDGMPRLTVSMTALLQGFPSTWVFSGGKTAAYRQVGNAFPPPVAQAVASSIHDAITRPHLALVEDAA